VLLAVIGEGTSVISPRVTAVVAERRAAAARTSTTLVGWKMLLG
jgi:hypothetical protein